jgi:hypothetical protein
MAADLSDRVRDIAAARDISESEVIEQALERGLTELWEDLVLAQYLDGDLDRAAAVDRVGRTTVERAERERDLVEEDVDWGLNAWGGRPWRIRCHTTRPWREYPTKPDVKSGPWRSCHRSESIGQPPTIVSK